jgi:hippurate hydrolase
VLAPGPVSGSEDVGLFATAAKAPLVYWILGGTDATLLAQAARNGTMDQDIPSNHSPHFAPVLDPTLRRGVDALITAAQSYLQPR